MSRGIQYSQQFKEDAVKYRKDHPERPDAVWRSDITYIWTCEGYVCLTSVMDLYSRKIIS